MGSGLLHLVREPVFLGFFVVAMALGLLVDMRINALVQIFRRRPPAGVTPENWETLLEWPETYGRAVHWLGFLERILFLLAFVMAMSWLVIVWLAFKLGCYGVAWHSFLRVTSRPAEMSEMDLMVFQNRRANALLAICIFGTLGNFLVIFLSVALITLMMPLFRGH
jgi:hypothetical protein